MLAAALPVAASLGIDPALVTCDNINLGSRKVIEANGGVFQDQRGVKLRYWVPTSASADSPVRTTPPAVRASPSATSASSTRRGR